MAGYRVSGFTVMPIEIREPAFGHLGPGLHVTVASDFIGPLPSTAFWLIYVVPTDGEGGNLWNVRIETQELTVVARVGAELNSDQVQGFPTTTRPDGTTVRLVAELHQDVLTVLQQNSIDVQWEASSGAWMLQPAAAAGGFTSEDRQTLLTVEGNTRVNYTEPTPVPADPSLPLGSFSWNGALGLLNRSESIVISGRGSAHRGSSSSQLDAYGARIFLLDWPPGYGRTPGAIDIFERRMVQLVVVRRTADGSEWASNIWDIHESGAIFRWEPPLPLRLEYLVAPGVTAELQWYTLPFQ